MITIKDCAECPDSMTYRTKVGGQGNLIGCRLLGRILGESPAGIPDDCPRLSLAPGGGGANELIDELIPPEEFVIEECP